MELEFDTEDTKENATGFLPKALHQAIFEFERHKQV